MEQDPRQKTLLPPCSGSPPQSPPPPPAAGYRCLLCLDQGHQQDAYVLHRQGDLLLHHAPDRQHRGVRVPHRQEARNSSAVLRKASTTAASFTSRSPYSISYKPGNISRVQRGRPAGAQAPAPVPSCLHLPAPRQPLYSSHSLAGGGRRNTISPHTNQPRPQLQKEGQLYNPCNNTIT